MCRENEAYLQSAEGDRFILVSLASIDNTGILQSAYSDQLLTCSQLLLVQNRFSGMTKKNDSFFFSLMTRQGEGSCRSLERSKNHTRSVFYEKTEHNLLKIMR